MTEWPHFVRHIDAVCRCGKKLRNLHVSGYAPGRGQYYGECCGKTWYDCAEGSTEMIGLNESREGHPDL